MLVLYFTYKKRLVQQYSCNVCKVLIQHFFSLFVVEGCIHWLMLLHQENCTLLGQERMDNWETTDCQVSIVLFLFIAAGMVTLLMEVNQHNSLWYTELLQGETSVIYLHQEMLVVFFFFFVKDRIKEDKAGPKKIFFTVNYSENCENQKYFLKRKV